MTGSNDFTSDLKNYIKFFRASIIFAENQNLIIVSQLSLSFYEILI